MIRLVLLRLLESYFRRRFLYLLPVVLMIGLAGVFIALSPPTYVARGALYVQNETLLSRLAPTGEQLSWVTPATVTTNEIGELLQTEAFVRAAIEKTDLEARMSQGTDVVAETIDMFRKSVWIEPLGEKLVRFSAKHESPLLAQQMASAPVDAYIQWKLNIDRQESEVAQAFFAEQLEPLQAQLAQARADVQAYLQAHPEPVRGERPKEEQLELEQLQAELNLAEERVEETREKEENARLALLRAETEVGQSYMVLDEPKLPEAPVRSERDIAITVILFMIVGGICGVVGVVGGMLLDRSFRLPLDVRHGLDLPVLAMVPESRMRVPPGAPAERQQSEEQGTQSSVPGVQTSQPFAGTRPEEQLA